MSDTKLNAVALYGNFVAMALLGLFVNPLLIHNLGAADFGIWKSCLRILDLSGVADGRATQALKWIIAHRANQANVAELRRGIGASIAIWLLWLPLLSLAVSLVVYALPWLISSISADKLVALRWTGTILAANVILSALLGIPDAVLFGTNQGYRSMILTTFYMVVSNAAMVAVTWAGYGLPALGLVVFTSTILNGLSTWLVARKQVSWWGLAKPRRADISRFAGFSNWTLVGSLVQMLLLSSELLLIGFLSGPVTVTKYTLNSYLIQFALSICLMTGSTITPKLGALIGGQDLHAAGKMITQTREILLGIMAIEGAGVILLNATFVTTWIGPEYYMGDTLNSLMVIAFLQLALIRYDSQVQDVGLKIARKVQVSLLAACTGLFLAGAGYLAFGTLEGLYIGLILGRMPATFLVPQMVVGLVPTSQYKSRAIVGLSAIIIASVLLAPFIHQEGWMKLGATSIGAAIVLGLAAYCLIFSAETRTSIADACSFRAPRSSH
ncbi:hypothetical protein IVB25_23880 [Bradyrhizobium sp. 193]|uniref:lipopolysaccharide biosynthesis protein n=1 Tax=Bradyrhizobium sp. 193 TaxID=2782661 RepID=UPI001FFC04DF|nr:hypothetical protein [Bradyrhizobium sp. 193]MCK1485647.1 hypothetical protein [Bradyrhizobium sp. 193]